MRESPWPLVASVYNLEVTEGLRPGPFVTARGARRIALAATRKLMRALAREGVDADTVLDYFRIKDEGQARQHDNLAMLLGAPVATRDESDPRRLESLRRVK